MKSSVVLLFTLSSIHTSANPFLQPRGDQLKPAQFLGPNNEVPITPYVIEAQKASQLAPNTVSRAMENPPPGGFSSDKILSYKNGYQHMIFLKINNSPFFLVLDTGSSNTWVMQKEYQCISRNGKKLPDKRGDKSIGDGMNCRMGPGYDKSYKPSDYHFEDDYADNTTSGGPLGYATLNVANINIPDQLVSLLSRSIATADKINN
jgi:hypothetical protein